ncbi:hypothetical protein [Bifidobacterium sp.]|jgi:hypothetical protein|uniref:hypothetical protein n=1 Tax=Bifidobacterium sp. TaxID=41200 RepID=UPI0025B80917|nr:hypothetical protein [Bifidobacterium sp.]MCH4208556.1 hypothetical protein [Bifidobacterium sp.]MCI1224242.1 hypothetical protein [Bifidobacterium sp.]
MPGWIWVVLVLFMLVVLVAGAAFVVVHAIRAMRVISDVGSAVNDRIAAMSERDESGETQNATAVFAQPLRTASERYAQAHSRVIARRMRRHERHVERWTQWRTFNR